MQEVTYKPKYMVDVKELPNHVQLEAIKYVRGHQEIFHAIFHKPCTQANIPFDLLFQGDDNREWLEELYKFLALNDEFPEAIENIVADTHTLVLVADQELIDESKQQLVESKPTGVLGLCPPST